MPPKRRLNLNNNRDNDGSSNYHQRGSLSSSSSSNSSNSTKIDASQKILKKMTKDYGPLSLEEIEEEDSGDDEKNLIEDQTTQGKSHRNNKCLTVFVICFLFFLAVIISTLFNSRKSSTNDQQNSYYHDRDHMRRSKNRYSNKDINEEVMHKSWLVKKNPAEESRLRSSLATSSTSKDSNDIAMATATIREQPASMKDEFRKDEILIKLSGVSDVSLLQTKNTPENLAFNFIAQKDKRKLPSNSKYLIQRYVVSLLYYKLTNSSFSTKIRSRSNGENQGNNSSSMYYTTTGTTTLHDLHFFTSLHECNWNKKIHNKKIGVHKCTSDLFITELFLPECNLVGSIPPEIRFLSNLTYLNMEKNHLTGSIPRFGESSKLKYIALSSNKLTGTVPESFSNLYYLDQLLLNDNNLGNGERSKTPVIPEKVCDLQESFGTLHNISADCFKPGVICDCCTTCCGEDKGSCGVNPKILEKKKNKAENNSNGSKYKVT